MKVVEYKSTLGENMVQIIQDDKIESMTAQQYAERLELEATKENGTIS